MTPYIFKVNSVLLKIKEICMYAVCFWMLISKWYSPRTKSEFVKLTDFHEPGTQKTTTNELQKFQAMQQSEAKLRKKNMELYPAVPKYKMS